MADTYKPGETAPKDGVIECTQYPGTTKRIGEGETFPPCDNWGEHHGKDCTWQYVGG